MPDDPPDPSGNLANILNDIAGGNTAAINTVSDLIGTVADLSGAAGGILAVVEGLLNVGKPSEVTLALEALAKTINTDFTELNQALNAQSIAERNTKLTEYLAKAETQLEGLPAFVSGAPSQVEIAEYIKPCIEALIDLETGVVPNTVWSQPFAWQEYWTDAGKYFCACPFGPGPVPDDFSSQDVGYGAQQPAPDAAGDVFIYRFSLPVYLQAVWLFLGVAGSLEPNFVTQYSDVIRRATSFLETNVYEEIMQRGLTRLSPPPPSGGNVGNTACPSGPSPPGIRLYYVHPARDTEEQTGAMIEYGTVEKFSGFSSIDDSYPIYGDDYSEQIFNKLQIRVLLRAKTVYVGVGLARVWEVLNQLKRLIGEPPLPRPGFADWSLREVFSLAQLPAATAGGSTRALATFMIETHPRDTPYPSPTVTVSVRTLLTNLGGRYPIPAGGTI
jgi:hypothetical protein